MKEKIYTLDFIRIISALCIYLFHSHIHLGCTYSIFTPFISEGAIFMVAFFILSGFSLYYNYFDRDTNEIKNVKKFYVKRLINIYPLYIVAYIFVGTNNLTLKQNLLIAPIELTLLQTFFEGSFSIGANSGTWFVSCIFICYLLFPFLNNLLKQDGFRIKRALIVVYFICAISPFCVLAFQFGSIYSNSFFRVLEFFIGMLTAAIFLKNQNKQSKNLGYIVALSIILFVTITLLKTQNIINYTTSSFITIPLFSFLIYHVAKIKKIFLDKILKSKILQYLSDISYAFFIAQFFTWDITKFLNKNFLWLRLNANINLIILSFLICLTIAILLHEIVEKPVKKQFNKRSYK